VRISWSNVIAGVLVGMPAGFFTNYLYDWAFPSTAGLGVQGLAVPVDDFSSLGLPGAGREGRVEIRYAQGTDTAGYACGLSVSPREVFEKATLGPACRRVEFSLHPAAAMPARYRGADTYPVFDVWVESPSGDRWEGSASIYLYVHG